jgi:hypothetical protein
MRVLLNKITLGLLPKPMILMLGNCNLSYRQIAQRADMLTLGLLSALAFTLVKLLVLFRP